VRAQNNHHTDVPVRNLLC